MTQPALAIRLAAAALLAVAIFAGGRSLLRSRLEVAAAERAASGGAAAVTQTVNDWADAVVPVAMADDGPAGVRARRAVFERLDAHRARQDTVRFVDDAVDALAIARRASLGKDATRSGAAWAQRLAERVANEAARFADPDDRLRLMTAADGVLTTARVVRGRPKPRPTEPLPTPAVTESVATTDAAPEPRAPRSPIVLADPERTPQPLPREVAATPAPGPDWRPSWGSKPAPAPIPPLRSRGEPVEPSKRSDDDRALLAELLASVDQDAAPWRGGADPRSARARGPVSAAEERSERVARERREALQRRLGARGFRGLVTDQVAALLDPSPRVRAALADRLLTSRSGDAVRLMLLLAEDEDASVRAAAVAAMGSSSDRTLVEHAWRIALRDPDPRVGRLADTLRVQLRQASLPSR